MLCGLPWSEAFITQLEEKEFRDAFVSDQVRLRIAGLVRALREQQDRGWSQAELGKRMGKPQNVVSRLEDPDYGRMSLATLLEVAAAFGLPLWVDIPNWDEWFKKIQEIPNNKTCRTSFDAGDLKIRAEEARKNLETKVCELRPFQPIPRSNTGDSVRKYDVQAC